MFSESEDDSLPNYYVISNALNEWIMVNSNNDPNSSKSTN